ncbi:hypothetical protein HZS55_12940 [Halosimplex rubrum]|uniref:MarR family transcriptional regulator n=1 Tax=Halosimplex rubrum TaxID=869889 RepID=A0A7D5TPI5_9EURY|nr:hypothetical protein [Halosimplex rubrum]QLH78154.1 hypothetical protein HZS55_12940 [Halosimplex rubrum]
MTRKYTQRDYVHMSVMRVRDWEFDARDIQTVIADDYDTEVSYETIRGALKTLREEGLLELTDDGNHYKRNF